jgi:hypothetical protein
VEAAYDVEPRIEPFLGCSTQATIDGIKVKTEITIRNIQIYLYMGIDYLYKASLAGNWKVLPRRFHFIYLNHGAVFQLSRISAYNDVFPVARKQRE